MLPPTQRSKICDLESFRYSVKSADVQNATDHDVVLAGLASQDDQGRRHHQDNRCLPLPSFAALLLQRLLVVPAIRVPSTGTTTGTTTQAQAAPVLDPHDDPSSRPVTVHLPEFGRVIGKRQSGVDFFGGLPYAAPPVGALRWAPPEPATPWAPSQLDATQFGPDCWQLVDPVMNPGSDVQHMSEDCLYLNIYTAAGSSSVKSSSKSRSTSTST